MKYDKHITERITKEDFKILKKSGHKVRDIIHEHNEKYLKTIPNGLLLQIEQIEKEIEDNNKKIAILQKENNEKKISIQLLNEKIEKTEVNIEELYSFELIEAVKDVIQQFKNNKHNYSNINSYLNEDKSKQYHRLIGISNSYNIALNNLKDLILKIYNE